MNSDKEFVLRGGSDEQASIYNRIAAIERIKYLTGGIDLRTKTAIYLKSLDLEMWKRWYENEDPNKKIDEEFCQRAAEVVLGMEGKDTKLNIPEYVKARHDYQKKTEVVDDNGNVKSNAQNARETRQDESRVCKSSAVGNN